MRSNEHPTWPKKQSKTKQNSAAFKTHLPQAPPVQLTSSVLESFQWFSLPEIHASPPTTKSFMLYSPLWVPLALGAGGIWVRLYIPCFGAIEPTCTAMHFFYHQRAPAPQACAQKSCRLPDFRSTVCVMDEETEEGSSALGTGWGWHPGLARNIGGTFLAPAESLSLSLSISVSLSISPHSDPQHSGGSCPGAGAAGRLSLRAAAAGGVVRPC